MDKATGLEHVGNGAVAVVFASGARKPVARVRLHAYFAGPGGYTGCYASWGAATLYAGGEALLLHVEVMSDTDGGTRPDDDGKVYTSRDNGSSWKEEGSVPANATPIASFEIPRGA